MRPLFFAILLAFSTPIFSAEDEVVASWQIEHPALTGFLSGLAFGLWPQGYASDRHVETATFTMRQGYGKQAFEYVKRHNERIFRAFRALGMSVWAMIGGALSFRFLKRARR
ncbi:MAG: hypothetical protein D6819_08390 [Gammaproteobacteria bacterium]|nr:MAG: hypothetical protein D6819_08390 [Gammaproteobacteria bacterium]